MSEIQTRTMHVAQSLEDHLLWFIVTAEGEMLTASCATTEADAWERYRANYPDDGNRIGVRAESEVLTRKIKP